MTDRLQDWMLNCRRHACAAFIVTTQVPVPEQPPPLQPAKVEPTVRSSRQRDDRARRKRCIARRSAADSRRRAGHGARAQCPPAKRSDDGGRQVERCALTVVAAFTVTTQVPVPEQPPPDQPVKVEPPPRRRGQRDGGNLRKCRCSTAPQLITPTSLVTVPVPLPDLVTVSVCPTTTLKEAVSRHVVVVETQCR